MALITKHLSLANPILGYLHKLCNKYGDTILGLFWFIMVICFYLPAALRLFKLSNADVISLFFFIFGLASILGFSLLLLTPNNKQNNFALIYKIMVKWLKSPNKLKIILENQKAILLSIGKLLSFMIIFILILFIVSSVFLNYSDLSSLEFSWCMLLYTRLTIIFPSLYLMHIFSQTLKCIKETQLSPFVFHYPDYSISKMNYSILQLLSLFTSVVIFDLCIKPHIIRQLDIYYISKLKKDLSISNIKNNMDTNNIESINKNNNREFISSIYNNPDNMTRSVSLGRHLNKVYEMVIGGDGLYLFTQDGRRILDASSGAAVSCLGYGNKKVISAIIELLNTGTPYVASTFWSNPVSEALCNELIKGTNNLMARVYLTGSGSEAMEATIKLSRQYFYEGDKQTPRVNFIAREGSYHGNTIGALSISGHLARRAPYRPFLMENVHHISSCNAYRQQLEGETDLAFVARKAAELDAKFQELGPETVIGVILEPVVGAAIGCVPSVPGYLKAMKDVCDKYGALFILDEVMCGVGRTGTLHAWQLEGVVPDIQIIAKALGGGYQPIGAVLASEKVINALKEGGGEFIHGQTYQAMPVQAAAALEVLRIIIENNLLENVSKQGAYLEKCLKAELSDHPYVGDIRGRGLFWGIEFVKDKITKEPFDPQLGVAQKISALSISPKYNMTVYPGTGSADGVRGDHIIISPPYIVTEDDINLIVKTIKAVIKEVHEELANKITEIPAASEVPAASEEVPAASE